MMKMLLNSREPRPEVSPLFDRDQHHFLFILVVVDDNTQFQLLLPAVSSRLASCGSRKECQSQLHWRGWLHIRDATPGLDSDNPDSDHSGI